MLLLKRPVNGECRMNGNYSSVSVKRKIKGNDFGDYSSFKLNRKRRGNDF